MSCTALVRQEETKPHKLTNKGIQSELRCEVEEDPDDKLWDRRMLVRVLNMITKYTVLFRIK